MSLRKCSVVALSLLTVCPQVHAAEPVTCPAPAAVSGEFAPQGIDMSTVSKAVRPGDDFFAYLNDGW
ncbi:MAG: hypothetical protein JF615_13075, partial [Asticcacaulis sp.]|nr:hypothetical protein [Asticcacaulis sp.]